MDKSKYRKKVQVYIYKTDINFVWKRGISQKN